MIILNLVRDDAPVAINPAHIIAVQDAEVGGDTRASEKKPCSFVQCVGEAKYYVRQTVTEVMDLIQMPKTS